MERMQGTKKTSQKAVIHLLGERREGVSNGGERTRCYRIGKIKQI